MPEDAPDKLQDTVIANSYKNVFGVPECELLASFTLSKKIIAPTKEEIKKFNVKYDPPQIQLTQEQIDDLKASYDTPVKEWQVVPKATVIGVDLAKKEYKFTFGDTPAQFLTKIKQEEHEAKDKLEEQIAAYIKTVYMKHGPPEAESILAKFAPSIYHDTGLTIQEFMDKHGI